STPASPARTAASSTAGPRWPPSSPTSPSRTERAVHDRLPSRAPVPHRGRSPRTRPVDAASPVGPLREEAGQAAVGQGLAARLAGRTVLEGRVGERHLADRVAAHGALLAGARVHPQAGLLLALEVL